jgi:hypothetical protein
METISTWITWDQPSWDQPSLYGLRCAFARRLRLLREELCASAEQHDRQAWNKHLISVVCAFSYAWELAQIQAARNHIVLLSAQLRVPIVIRKIPLPQRESYDVPAAA